MPRNVTTKMDLLQRLQKYYESKGISAQNFRCPYEDNCKANSPNFIEATEAYVGSKYGYGKLPRLLFITAGPGGNLDWSTRKRTVNGIRELWAKCDTTEAKKGKWWYRTNELALAILENFEHSLDMKQVKHYFAYTDSEKCSQNKKDARQNDNTLFKNCAQFLPEEVAILSPDIVVTQGNKARDMIQGAIKDNIFEKCDPHDYVSKGKRIPSKIKAIKVKGKVKGSVMLWIDTVHPTERGLSNFERYKNWDAYSANSSGNTNQIAPVSNCFPKK
jgi:hypothetical protein